MLNTGKPYQVFIEIFYELVHPYLIAYDLLELKKLENILSV